ncbi:AgrD family cyclic lactone autoinducer peptide [Anaerobacterium chartisolvens]
MEIKLILHQPKAPKNLK